MGPYGGNVVLETRNLTKRFPSLIANDRICIKLYEGEILSFLGENGAGKSTMMNMLYGLFRPSSGQILLRGEAVSFSSPREAIQRGLGMVHQHFMLVGSLTVTQNIILGNEPGKNNVINYQAARKRVAGLSERYGLKVDPDSKVEDLSVGVQQKVEILKALYRDVSILILDEPTAVLTPQEVEAFFKVVKRLQADGVSIIIITHKLEEVLALSDRCYILRQGVVTGEMSTEGLSRNELANCMVGREVVLKTGCERLPFEQKEVFSIENHNVINDKGVNVIKNLSLKVNAGEILGIAGVDGNGQSELAEAIMGLIPSESGRMTLNGKEITALNTKERILNRISYVPSDRHSQGLILPMSIAENMMIGFHGYKPFCENINLDLSYIHDNAEKLVNQFDIRSTSPQQPAGYLSGGNQQKIILAREFSRNPDFLVISQPTRGLDVGAIEYIHSQIINLRNQGIGILLISMELEEILALSDRIHVLFEGRIVAELDPAETNKKEMGLFMMGGKNQNDKK